jgi:hypothetical protein
MKDKQVEVVYHDPVFQKGAGLVTVIKDDVSVFGVHRKHFRRTGGQVDEQSFLSTIPKNAIDVYHHSWIDEKGDGHLYIAWKEI